MRVALVNDLTMALEALRRVVQSMPDAEIAWIAEDGARAVERCQQDRPDLILMDMLMPGMDGVEATRRIMSSCPCPILVTTASVKTNVSYVYEALGHGAIDAVNTPVLGVGGSLQGAEDLIRKMRLVMKLGGQVRPYPPCAAAAAPRTAAAAAASCRLVAIGASTGGPQALRQVCSALSAPLAYALLVVQHLDTIFVPGFAQWLAKETGLPVQLVEAGRPPVAGAVSVACTNDHLVLDAQGRLQYVAEPRGCVHRPSVDVFFGSLLRAPVSAGAAVLLTGMGQDGAHGLKGLRDAGWETIAQDEGTSVVWGMPGSAVRLGAANRVLPAAAIGPAIDQCMRSRTAARGPQQPQISRGA
jgi:two-component system response regulator WspF